MQIIEGGSEFANPNINWNNLDSCLMVNPHWSNELKDLVKVSAVPELPGHIWLASSGVTQLNMIKLVGLSKAAILSSAKSVNKFLGVVGSDRWLNALPNYHIGGLSIFARAFVGGNKVVIYSKDKWNVGGFFEHLNYDRIQWTSLVPTQLYDLVNKQVLPPSSLKGVLVGGGALEESVYERAVKLGWPIYLTYGMTETSSQIATSNKNQYQLKLLPHLETRIDSGGQLEVKGSSLLTGYFYVGKAKQELVDPKIDSWFKANDLVQLDGGVLSLIGRIDEVKKIGGVLISRLKLQSVLNEILQELGAEQNSGIILLNPNSRLEHQVDLVLKLNLLSSSREIITKFNSKLSKIECVTNIYYLDEIPTTPLGKAKISEINKKILS